MAPRERYAVLTVDDDPRIRRTLRGVLEDEGHETGEAANASEAYEALERRRWDAVLLDLSMPGEHGLDALVHIRERAPDTAVIVVSGESTLENAVKAGQRGAFDFVPKPVEAEHLLDVLREAVRLTRLRRGASGRQGGNGGGPRPSGAQGPEGAEAGPVSADEPTLGIVGQCPAVERMREQIRRVAPSNGRVLITGENGSGKELAALAIHALSKRSDGPFVKLNCAAIPRDLLESELFGYEKGAFTGAVASKKGRLELADQGTLFLDEVGDLAAEAQAKLLRVVETGEVERVGGTRTQTVDVRIVAATNKDLPAAIEAGEFREDLYYRLNVLPLHVPALRERRGDVRLLAGHFLGAFAAAEGREAPRLEEEAAQVLEGYAWPGNVRELRNLMERATVLVPGDVVRAADLSPWLERAPAAEEATGLRGELDRREAEAIRRTLEGANWNVTQAAAALGIDRTNLHRKMRKYEIGRR